MKLYTTIIATALFAATTISSAWAGESLDRVLANKMLKVATDANWPPMSFLNDDNEMDGFDISVAREVAKRLGVGVEFVTPDWTIITSGNWKGRWDVSIGSMTPTKARAEVLSFPGVYYFVPKTRGENDLRDVEVCDQNFLQQPGNVQKETANPIDRDALVVRDVHAAGDVDGEGARAHAEADEQRVVPMPGQQ